MISELQTYLESIFSGISAEGHWAVSCSCYHHLTAQMEILMFSFFCIWLMSFAGCYLSLPGKTDENFYPKVLKTCQFHALRVLVCSQHPLSLFIDYNTKSVVKYYKKYWTRFWTYWQSEKLYLPRNIYRMQLKMVTNTMQSFPIL